MPRLFDQTRTAALILAVAAATLGGAWIFQALGHAPCELCLKQRIPYYAGVPLAALALALARAGLGGAAQAALAALALLFAGSAVFGAYHAGVEWGVWPGPSDCAGPIGRIGSTNDLLRQLQAVKVVRCDEVTLRVFGLSLAVWNALISLSLAVVAGLGATRPAQGARSSLGHLR
ncbi:disulfide bond formation protein B [Methylocella sp.]|uniref:disulfide bond formation protein B n=1 Tax=Methylocella sp. TaxID=1978226 RepID=UPI003784D6B0